jgi:ABC-type branched-subunit amino acid transport system permease subunit
VLGFMFIITMLFAPQGIVGAVKSLAARYRAGSAGQ